jgi:hypothetical protein
MIKHIVMWKRKEQAEQGTRQEGVLRVKALLGRCSSSDCGPDKTRSRFGSGADSGPRDVVPYSEFAERAVLEAYQQHPVDLAAVFIGKVREHRVAVDYEVSR